MPDAWWSCLEAHINRNSSKELNLESSLFHLLKLWQQREKAGGRISLQINSAFPTHQARQKAAAAAAAGLRMFRTIGSGAFSEAAALLFFWRNDVETSTWKVKKSKSPHLCLQKLSVFLHHLIYRHIFWFWGRETRENPTLLAQGGIGW